MTIGAGGDIFSGSTYFANVKLNIWSRPNYNFSTSINYYLLPPDFIETNSGSDIRDMAMITGAATWGTSNHHLTIGAGYMYIESGFLPPFITLSGTVRVAKNFALVSENWYFNVEKRIELPVIVSLGIRYISKRSTVDVAYYSDNKSRFDSGLPYFSFLFNLNRHKLR